MEPTRTRRDCEAAEVFLKNIAWGGLQAGTQFAEPAPLFPRAEKDAVERMQQIEEENSKSVIEAATTTCGGGTCGAANGGFAAKAEEVNTPSPATTEIPATLAAEPQPAPPQVAQVVEEKQYISIEDVIKVDLRVAQILVAERVPKADKLLRLEVDLGYEKRQILAGIAQYYEPETLIGRKIVIVANLAPRKMRGLESNGMLLAASLEGGSPVLAGFLEEVPLGARLK